MGYRLGEVGGTDYHSFESHSGFLRLSPAGELEAGGYGDQPCVW